MLTNGKHIIYEFDAYRLDPSERRLLRGEEQIQLPPKAFETLVVLVENNGHLVEKEELMQRVWADSFVEEGNLKISVYTLRKILVGSNFIETVPKKGYRFNAPVRLIEPASGEMLVEKQTISKITISATEIDQPDKNYAPPFFAQTISRPKVYFSIALLVCLGLSGAFYFAYFSNQTGKAAKTLIANPLAEVKTIAVLPLKSLSNPPQDQELRVGMTDSIVTKLSAVRQLTVRPTSATNRYLDQNYDTIGVGRELKVDSVLEGSVQKEKEKLKINLQMVNVADGRVVWAETFANDLSNVLSGQESVSNRVSRLMALNLDLALPANAERSSTDLQAQELYLKGNYALAISTRKIENIFQARDFFEQTIRLDPNYASAYSGLALTYTLAASLQLLAPQQSYPAAEKAARRALELDPHSAAAHVALAEIESDYNWNWETAEVGYRRALELAPNLATAHHSYSEFLARMGRFEESAHHSEVARQLDPTRINYEAVRALHYIYEHRFDEAIAQSRMVTEKDPNAYLAWLYLSYTQAVKGDYRAGIEAGEKARAITGGGQSDFFVLGCNYAAANDEERTGEILAAMHSMSNRRYVDFFLVAMIHAYRGDKDQAFAYMEKAHAEKSYWMTSIKVHPVVNSLRSDARFAEMLKRMNLDN